MYQWYWSESKSNSKSKSTHSFFFFKFTTSHLWSWKIIEIDVDEMWQRNSSSSNKYVCLSACSSYEWAAAVVRRRCCTMLVLVNFCPVFLSIKLDRKSSKLTLCTLCCALPRGFHTTPWSRRWKQILLRSSYFGGVGGHTETQWDQIRFKIAPKILIRLTWLIHTSVLPSKCNLYPKIPFLA